MFRQTEQPDQSPCPPWQLFLWHAIQAERLSPQQRGLVVDHIARCERCADMYEALCDANAELWEQAAGAAGVPKRQPVATRSPEEALADTWRRIEADEAAQRLQRRRAMVFRTGGIAAAACILIAVGIGWLTSRSGKPSQDISGVAANPGGSPAAFAELLTDKGLRPLGLNQPVATADQAREVLLGGMHRVVMNRNTTATFATAPALQRGDAPQAGKIPYEIHLARGELYVEVVPGHRFTVRTGNARLDITGTKFDVRADGDKTELTLLKGSVRFSALDHPQQAVSVTAGHASTIAGRRAPSAPAPVDAIATTVWARETALRNAVALADGQANVDLSAISQDDFWRQPDPPDVDTLNYATWRDEHQQFSRVFMLPAAVRNGQAGEADWIELLMVSGDIWQFHYDPELPSSQPLTKKMEPMAIARLARHYGLDERDMLRSTRLPDSTPNGALPVQDQSLGRWYAEALRRWHDALTTTAQEESESKPDLKVLSLRASQHLADTRTAAYLWAKAHPQEARQLLADGTYVAMLPIAPEPADEDEWIRQLRQQAVAARSCVPAAMEWLLLPAGTGCAPQASDQQRRLAALVAELTPALPDRESQGK